MNGGEIQLGIAVITVVLLVIGFVQQTRKSARDAAQADNAEKARIAGEAFSQGARSRDDEIALLRSQRDDARRERDRFQRIADERDGRA